MSSIFEKDFAFFLYFFNFFQKRGFLYLFMENRARYILYMSRAKENYNKKTVRHRRPVFFYFSQQPLQFLQLPEHFLLCLPVAEYISPE